MADDAQGSGNWILRALAKGRDPRTRLTALIDVVFLLGGYYFLYVYQDYMGLQLPLLSVKTLLAVPLVGLVLAPLIHYVFVLADPLQRSPSRNREVRFFQNAFPSRYLLQRCNACAEDRSTCANYLAESSGACGRLWFTDIFHGAIEQEDPQTIMDTFEKGYACKLVFFVKQVLLIFLVLAVGVLVGHHLYLWLHNVLRPDISYGQGLFPVTAFLIWIVVHWVHRADPHRPSGCWHAWQEINRFHVAWMSDHESELVRIVCKRGGGQRSFRRA